MNDLDRRITDLETHLYWDRVLMVALLGLNVVTLAVALWGHG